jgi:hypothetical protein
VDHQSTLAVIVAIVGIAGTLAGIFMGHFLGRSWDRKKWLLDRRNEEFKELLTAIALAYAKCGDPRYHLWQPSVEGIMEMNQASAECLVTIQNRIYIAKYIRPLHLDSAWLGAMDAIVKDKNPEQYGSLIRKMMDSVVRVAEEHCR